MPVSFFTQRQKLLYINSLNKQATPILIREETENKQRFDFLNTQLLSSEQNYKNTYFSSTEWELMNYEKRTDGEIYHNDRLYKTWNIEFNQFDYRFLSYLHIEPLVRTTGVEEDADAEIIIYKNILYTIFDYNENSNYQRIGINVSLEIYKRFIETPLYQREAKLLIQYVNPIKVI